MCSSDKSLSEALTMSQPKAQFVDPMMIISNCQRRISFLIAKASYDRKLVGSIAKGLETIPVVRPQDAAFKGKGNVFLAESQDPPTILRGISTNFTTSLAPKSSISFPLTTPEGKITVTLDILEVVSDVEAKLSKPVTDVKLIEALKEDKGGVGGYKITPYVDQGEMFSKVTEVLAAGGAVGIFPEGGSHDRMQLLPLKAGVAIMALSAPSTVKIVPVGLNYFHPHRFRSRAVVEFGTPLELNPALQESFKTGNSAAKRDAVSTLMADIRLALRAVTVEFEDFDTLMIVTVARKLYKPKGSKLKPSQVFEMSRQFIRGYLRFKDTPRVAELSKRLLAYNNRLETLGLRDHQVEKLVKWKTTSFIKTFGLLALRSVQVLLLALFAMPGVIVNSPIMLLCEVISRQKAKAALAGSSVKIKGHDVIATWKILVAAIALPLVHLILSLSVAFLFSTILARFFMFLFLFFIASPLVSYAGVRAVEVGLDIVRSLRPLSIAIWKPTSEWESLRAEREELQKELVDVVGTYQHVGEDVSEKVALDENEKNKTEKIDKEDQVATAASSASSSSNFEDRRASIPSASPLGHGGRERSSWFEEEEGLDPLSDGEDVVATWYDAVSRLEIHPSEIAEAA
ncbi:hypothetical protein HDU97_000364 [Phlyctochytrium planicorne]|nr:hypothetical protein HDU97_000364 [Phlyctochytrium planicorne]